MGSGRNPRNPHGSDFANVAERHPQLPHGALLLLAWLLAAYRGRRKGILAYSLAEACAVTGWDSRTVLKHLHSLRQKGLAEADAIRATPAALRRGGEHYARLSTRDMMRQPTSAVFKAVAADRLCTDGRGRIRSPRQTVADLVGVSRRRLRQLTALVRLFEIPTAATSYRRAAITFRSTRQKASALLAKRLPPLRKGG